MAVEIDVEMPEGGVITLGPEELRVFSAIQQVFPGSQVEQYTIWKNGRFRIYKLLSVINRNRKVPLRSVKL